MTNQTGPTLERRRAARTAVLVGATLVLSLSASPGAHADGGLLDDVTQTVGDVTDPVVTPAVEAVQSAVPQPVQQAVEPAVEHVVEPVVEQVEQAGTAVPGADRVVEPVVEVVEPVVRPAERPAEEPAADPAEEPAGEPVDPPAAGTTDPSSGEAGSPGATGAAGEAATTSEPAGDPVREGNGPAGTGGPRDGQRPSGDGTCTSATDLPPRGMTTPVSAGLAAGPDDATAEPTLWGLVNALMHTWADDPRASADVGAPDRRLADVPWFDVPGDPMTGAPAFGRSGTVPVLLGLVALLGLLLTGVALARARQLDGPRRWTA